ncbi:MAG TPA: FecR domain-containing protein [Bryobacteraceae bacterium]|nr:FecR domain-containing protein [Bryobacteraceae bacterium]
MSAAANAQGRKTNPAGKIYVADAEGGVMFANGDKIDQLAKKAVCNAEGSVIQTEANASVSIVLSNSTGIHLDGGTRIKIREFKQEQFRPNRSDLEEEPSVSHTQLFVEYGTIGISTGKLAAESTLEVDTPDVSASVHGGQAVIQVMDGSTKITMIHGSATVHAGSLGTPSWLKGGQQLQVHEGSLNRSSFAEVLDIPAGDAGGSPPPPDANVAGAEAAQQAVYFNVQVPTGGVIQVFEGDAAQGPASTQGGALEVVAIPAVPANPPVVPTVSAANLISGTGG